jgi:hypothetical protein
MGLGMNTLLTEAYAKAVAPEVLAKHLLDSGVVPRRMRDAEDVAYHLSHNQQMADLMEQLYPFSPLAPARYSTVLEAAALVAGTWRFIMSARYEWTLGTPHMLHRRLGLLQSEVSMLSSHVRWRAKATRVSITALCSQVREMCAAMYEDSAKIARLVFEGEAVRACPDPYAYLDRVSHSRASAAAAASKIVAAARERASARAAAAERESNDGER